MMNVKFIISIFLAVVILMGQSAPVFATACNTPKASDPCCCTQDPQPVDQTQQTSGMEDCCSTEPAKSSTHALSNSNSLSLCECGHDDIEYKHFPATVVQTSPQKQIQHLYTVLVNKTAFPNLLQINLNVHPVFENTNPQYTSPTHLKSIRLRI